jgi:hypothetical protein
MLILSIRQCSFCGKKYQLGATERKMMEQNPRFAPVHDECIDEWKKLPPLERIKRYAMEESHAQTKWRDGAGSVGNA